MPATQKFEIEGLAQGGLNKDLAPQRLAPNQARITNNLRAIRGGLSTFPGHVSMFTSREGQGAAAKRIDHLMGMAGLTQYFWFYVTGTQIRRFDGVDDVLVKLSVKSAHAGNNNYRWFNAQIANAGVIGHEAQYPLEITNPDDISEGSSALSFLTWDATDTWKDKAWTAKRIIAFKNFLVALNLTEAGAHQPTKVRWSDVVTSGGVVPGSWDETDLTTLAGYRFLSDTSGHIVDALPLRDALIIYKEDSAWAMTLGGSGTFTFTRLPDIDLMAMGCVVEVEGRHVVVSNGDILEFDGVSPPQSIADERVREWFFRRLRPDRKYITQAIVNARYNEVWIGFSEVGADSRWMSKALVWNYRDRVWTTRALDAVTCFANGITFGPEPDTGFSWDDFKKIYENGAQVTWDSMDRDLEWGGRQYDPLLTALVFGTADPYNQCYIADQTTRFDGEDIPARWERRGLTLGEWWENTFITAIYLRMEGDPVEVWVGSQDYPEGNVTWVAKKTFSPETQDDGDGYKIDCRVGGKHHAIRIECPLCRPWTLYGMQVHYELHGDR